MSILTLKIDLDKLDQDIISHFPSSSLNIFWSKSLIFPWVFDDCSLIFVHLCVCVCVYGLFALCHCRNGFTQSNGYERCELGNELEEQRDCNQEKPPKGRESTQVPWGSSSALENCFDRITELGARVKFLGHQTRTDFLLTQTTETPVPLGNRRSRWRGCSVFQGWLE